MENKLHENLSKKVMIVRGERANFPRLVLGWLAGWLAGKLVLGCIEAKFCKSILNTIVNSKYSLENS